MIWLFVVLCDYIWILKSFFLFLKKMRLECNENQKPQWDITSHLSGWILWKKQRQHVLARMWRNCKWGTLLVGMQNDVDAMENRLFKNKNTIWSSNNTSCYLSKINEIKISSDISTCMFISALFAMEKLNFHQ